MKKIRHIFYKIIFISLILLVSKGELSATDRYKSNLAFNQFICFLLPQNMNASESIFRDSTKKYAPLFKKSPIYRNRETSKYSNKYQPDGYSSETKLDTLSGNFVYRESINDKVLSPPLVYEFDEYLRMRKEQIQRNAWDSLTFQYDLKKALSGGDLASMMATATGLKIPIPPNPLVGIFGKPEININVNGEVNLRAGWRWDTQNLGTVSAFGQTQSTPIFSQNIRVNVSGGIGDKLKLSTDWNTTRNFDRENTFKVGFDGYDDDIIKKIEVGNVSLPLPTQLIQGGQTLFGLRSDYQFGPLFLKTILSQKRGEKKYVDIQNGSNKTYFQIRAYDYAKNHFFLDNEYKPIWNEYFKNSTPIIPQSSTRLRIKEIEVWESTSNLTDVNSANGIAFATLEPKVSPLDYPNTMKTMAIQSGIVERGRFVRLDSTKYKIDRNLGHLTIVNLRSDKTYAVAYRTENLSTTTDADDLYHGQFSHNINAEDTTGTLILKLVYRPNLQPGFDTLWSRQMKNIYPINASNVNVEETRIGVWYIGQTNDSTDVLQGAPDKTVTIFGVDKVNTSGAATPDGIFDIRQPSPFFDPLRGEIIFPSVEPFRQGLRDYFTKLQNADLAESYVYNEIYDQTVDMAKRNTARDRFIISGEVSGKVSGRIPLGAYNLAPNSVRVTLDGVALKEYQDFTIDYYAGILQLRNERATVPGANLKVEYEQQDIFNISTKTLAGLRADYNLLTTRKAKADLGFTLMHYDQSAVVDRVTLGQEPVSNTMFGFDGKLVWDTPFITEALDWLPFLDTKAESNVTFGGEWAMILPNPNKRTSTVSSDNGSPVVYIDDFDGAQRYINLGLNASMWSHSSQPIDTTIGMSDQEVANYRGKMWWFKKFLPDIPRQDVYPEQPVLIGRNNISSMDIFYNPYERGIYNFNPNYIDKSNPEYDNQPVKFIENQDSLKRTWAGMQRLLSTFTTNFDNENIEYIEIMMRLEDWTDFQNTKMYIDLGQISEDVIPNQTLNTEDGSTRANPLPNNIIDAGEDRGLDTLDNTQEKIVYPFPLNLENDPARDDYLFNFGKENVTHDDFRDYNNFEGNSKVSEAGQFPDTEILNQNNGQTLSLDNSYFRYEVNLNQDPNQNPQIVGGNLANRWVLYRLPVRKFDSKIGNPSFTNIQYIRVLVQGGRFYGRIVDWRLVGSQWQRTHNFQSVPADDEVMQISFVNLFENSKAPDNYSMPPGVEAPRQLNNPTGEDIRQNEQSVALTVTDLNGGQERMAVRIYPNLDVFNYKKLKFFIHGEDNMSDPLGTIRQPNAYAYVRFGTDSANYYEYRTPIVRGWKDVEIDLTELTAIKQLREASGAFIQNRFEKIGVGGDPNALYAIKGTPVLTRLRFFGLGISNPNSFQTPLTTTVWFNELRLIEPERSNDWAALANASVKLADVGTINANFQYQQPNFHKLEERFGDRSTTGNFNVSMQGSLEKFLPTELKQIKLPVTYTHSEMTIVPEYVANSDVKLNVAAEAARADAISKGKTEQEAQQMADSLVRRSQTIRVQDRFALTGVKLGVPITFFLLDETINKMTFGYSYSQEWERSPVYAERFNWIWQADAKYSNQIPNVLEFEPLKWAKDLPILSTYSAWKLNLLPTSVNAGLQMTRRRQTEQSRYLDFASPVLRDFNAIRSASFNWKLSQGGFLNPTIDYNLMTNSSLVSYEIDEFGKQRGGKEIFNQIFLNDGLINFGEDATHNQSFTLNIKPVIPDISGLNKFLTMSGSFVTNYTWQNPLQKDITIRDLSKNASYTNNINFKADLLLKEAADKWFGIKTGPGFGSHQLKNQDTSSGFFSSVGSIVKTIFFDYQKILFKVTQTNNTVNPGVFGSSGITNFWARGTTFRESENIYGPSAAYQLGLVGNPHGSFDIVKSDMFPYFGFETTNGLRPANGVMQDNFKQDTKFDISTSRPLWEGAKLDLTWATSLGFNKNQTVITDANGVPEFSNIITLESFKRSYITMPSFFGFNIANNTIENVVALYEAERDRIDATNLDTLKKTQLKQEALSSAFYNGLEAFSFSSGAIGKFLPSINWTFTWEGLEKWDFWKEYVKKARISHAYTSTYDESAQATDKGRNVQNQQVNYGFQPLVGVDVTFDEKKFDGIFTAGVTWNTKSGYNLNSAAKKTIAEQSTNEITARASYVLNGFKFALLGIDLENELEYSFTFKYAKNRRATFDILDAESYANNNGRTLNGDTKITIEPRIRYALSKRLTASFFLKYDGNFTEGAANPGFHTTEVGLDIRLSISGGR